MQEPNKDRISADSLKAIEEYMRWRFYIAVFSAVMFVLTAITVCVAAWECHQTKIATNEANVRIR